MTRRLARTTFCLLTAASVLLGADALAADPVPVAWEALDTDGDGVMWLCQQPRSDEDTRGILRVDTSGYYDVSTLDDSMFDSGDHQRNESYFLRIKNSKNPEGHPIDPNCAGVFVLRDGIALPAHLGTFYLDADEDNLIEMHHYCGLWRDGLCGDLYDPAGEGGGGCANCESVSLVLDTLLFDRTFDVCRDDTQTVSTQDWCDGLDNDCDGGLDEDATGVCGDCDATGLELCDGVDNDCDGAIDEADSSLCEPGYTCAQGACREACRGLCSNTGESCQDGLCLPEPCGVDAIHCAAGQTCVGGACQDVCAGMTCPAGTTCQGAACVDTSCHTTGCPTGQVCVVGQCTDDLCADATCAPAAFCRFGACVASCADVTCGDGQRCVDGACQDDACAALSCAAGQICASGQCIADACAAIDCPAPLRCQYGVCVGDLCDGITCPAGQSCRDAQCLSPAQAQAYDEDLARPSVVDTNAEGGCGCRALATAPPGSRLAWFGVFGLLGGAVWRRRRVR